MFSGKRIKNEISQHAFSKPQKKSNQNLFFDGLKTENFQKYG